jgi:hypothetical protein
MKKLLLLFVVFTAFSFKANSQVVFSENFDGIGPGISGWTLYNEDGLTPNAGVSTITDAWVNSLEEFNNHVAKSTSWYSAVGTSNDYLVSPGIAIPATGSSVLYWDARAYDSTYRDSYNVYVSSTGNTVADFVTPLFTQGDGTTGTSGENTTWTRRSIDLSNFAGQTVYIAFQNFSTDMFLLSLDNIMVVNNNTCLAPNRTMTSTATINTATVNWTAVAGAAGYEIAYDVTGFIPSTAMGTSTTNSFTASSLIPNTAYDFYVRNSCGSEWIGPFGAVTSAVVPYAYGFETTGLGAGGFSTLPSTAAGGGSWGQFSGTTLAQEGTKFAACLGSTTAATDAWLFTNGIKVTAGEVLSINYYFRKYNAAGTTSVNKLKSAIGTVKTAAGMATVVKNHNTVTSTTYAMQTSPYTVPADGTYYLGFNSTAVLQTTAQQGGILVDNITITSSLSNNQFDLVSGLFLISPNPVKSTFELKLSEKFDTSKAEIKITDLNGKVISVLKYASTYDVSYLSQGIYLVSITDGNLKDVKKLIKE